jgi:hypothetical protein
MAGHATIIREASSDRPAALAREPDERRGADCRDGCADDGTEELTAAQGHAFQQDVTG